MPEAPVTQVVLDAGAWRARDDVYDALLTALRAPDWHGRNLDALWDSLVSGDINEIEPPLAVEVRNTSGLPSEVRTFLRVIADLFDEARREDVDISIRFVPRLETDG